MAKLLNSDHVSKKGWRVLVGLLLTMLLILGSLVVVYAEDDSQSAALLTDDASAYGGHLYRRFDLSMNWNDAKKFCENVGGHLVTVSSTEEQAFLEGMLADGSMNCCFKLEINLRQVVHCIN